MRPLEPGQLLVATPALTDPNFDATVILLLDVTAADEPGEHGGPGESGEPGGAGGAGGAVGVVLNRPSGVAVAEVLAPWAGVVDEPEVLFQGGPVSTEGALAVARLRPGTEPPVGWSPMREGPAVGSLGIVDLDAPVELVRDALADLRVYAGYAGWGGGQLEREVAEGSWYVVPGEAGDVFRADSSTLWRDVLRRQPGELAWLSTRPADPFLN